jgi:hypothetical protein
MNLIDRYVEAVRTHLRRPDADDIVAEIRTDLESQIDALGNDDVAGVLRRYGHPRIVAARYSEHPSLIGPELLPFYWQTLRIVGSAAVASLLAGGLIGAVGFHEPSIFVRSLGYAWNASLIVAGAVTILFATMERVATPQRSVLDRLGITRWDPRRLPAWPAHAVSDATSIVDVVANGIALLLLLDVARFREGLFALLVPGARDWVDAPTAAWQPLFVAVLASSTALAVTGLITLLRPHWTALRAGVYAAVHAGIVVGAALTLLAGPLIEPANPALEALAGRSVLVLMCVAALLEAVYFFGWLRTLPNAWRGAPIGSPGQRS